MPKIFSLLLITGAIHGFIFNVATFFSRKKIEKTIVYLNLIVLFLSLNNLQAWLIDNEITFVYYYLKHLLIPWYLLIVPMFYVFLLHYLKIEEKLWPFLIITLILFGLEFFARSGVIIYSYYNSKSESLIKAYNNFEEIVNAAYSVFIYIKAWLVLFKYERLYKYILQFDNIAWIKRFIYLGAFILFAWLMAIWLNNYLIEIIKPPYSYYPLRFCSSVLLYWIGYQGFFRYVVVNDRIQLRKSLKKDPELSFKGSIENSDSVMLVADKSKKDQHTYHKIHQHIVENKSYLNPQINLENLSKELNISSNRISRCINIHTPFNFSDFINQFRIAQVKRLLESPDFNQYTIEAIGLECGFNSKSAFYTAFKKFTDLTPTDYRKTILHGNSS